MQISIELNKQILARQVQLIPQTCLVLLLDRSLPVAFIKIKHYLSEYSLVVIAL